MRYDVTWFTNGQRRDYEHFLGTFKDKSYRPEAFIGSGWWQSSGPLGGFLILAYTPDEIASRCVLTGRRLAYQGEVIDCFEIGGTCTLDRHQRKGLFTMLVKKAMELGFETPARLIYGTPNDRSGPGYRKLGYSFIDQPDSHFVLLTRSIHPLLRKVGLKKGPVTSVTPGPQKEHTRGWTITEVDLNRYVDATREFPRMNWPGQNYLEQRLGTGGSAGHRRFFHASSSGKEAWYALNNYELSFLRLILASEYFMNGRPDHGLAKFRLLKKIASAWYRNHDGIYLKCRVDPDVSPLVWAIKHRLFVHRTLPTCYFASPRQSSGSIDQLMQGLNDVFQLTDCDIG